MSELKSEALRSVLLTAVIAKKLDNTIISSLVDNMERFEEKLSNLIIITL